MEELLRTTLEGFPLVVLIGIAAFTLYTLSKGADILVDEAVALSVKWGIPKMIIGATIVSLGTTLPEAAVSVGAALQGNPDLALGNAVGSVICDTALIIGLASFVAPLTIDKSITNRQGWLQLGAGFLLVAVSIPWLHLDTIFSGNGSISQLIGFGFVALLIVYLVTSVKSVKRIEGMGELVGEIAESEKASSVIVVLKLIAGTAIIIVSSKILIPSVAIVAVRIGIPQSIIAATLVAFGTSLPEMLISVQSAIQGNPGIVLGNAYGSNIANIGLILGCSALLATLTLTIQEVWIELLLVTCGSIILMLLMTRYSVMIYQT